MSFLSVLKKIGSVVRTGITVVEPFDPLLESIPGFGGPFMVVLNVIHSIQVVAGDGNGAAKKEAAAALLKVLLPGLSPAAMPQVIDAVVAALDAVAAAQTATAKGSAAIPSGTVVLKVTPA